VVAAVVTYILLARRTGQAARGGDGRGAEGRWWPAGRSGPSRPCRDGPSRSPRWQFGIASSLPRQHRRPALRAEEVRRGGAAPAQGARPPCSSFWLAQADAGRHPLPPQAVPGGWRRSSRQRCAATRARPCSTACTPGARARRGEKKKAIEILQKGVAQKPVGRKAQGRLLGARAQNDKRLKLDGWGRAVVAVLAGDPAP